MKKKGKFKNADPYNLPARDFREIVKNYKNYSSSFELKMFILIPLSVSIFIFTLLLFFSESNRALLSAIVEMNNGALTVVAILAGFNTTSLSIIAASNNKVLHYLVEKKTEPNGNVTILKQLVSLFSFAILTQLIVLILGILFMMFSKSLAGMSLMFPLFSGFPAKIILLLLGVTWLATILFTIMISVRNATLLYRYVLFVADYKEIDITNVETKALDDIEKD